MAGMRVILLLGAICFALVASTAAAPTTTVLWQFQRANGVKLFGADLEADLGSLRIEEGTSVTFNWDEGTFHSLFEATDETNYLSCNAQSGTRLVPVPSSVNSVVITPTLGSHYYFDDFQSSSLGCANAGLKIAIEVVEIGNLITTVAPTTPVPAVTTTLAPNAVAQTVTWHFEPSGQAVTEIWIAANEQIRFQWDNSGIQHTLRQVDKDAYENCDETAEGVDWSGPVTLGDVVVSNLEVGTQYFICYLPTHCSSGHMKLKVNVVPADQPYYVTVWPDDSDSTSDPVYVSIVGHDDANRLWVSPQRQLNLQPVASDPTQVETATLDGTNPAVFEIYLRNVGFIDTIKIQASGQTGWIASKVNIAPTSGEEQSRTFSCSGRAEDWTGVETLQQYCIAESVITTTIESVGTSSNSTNGTLPEDCQCFRQFLVHNPSERVLTCTSNGCYATIDNGMAGWGDITGIARLVGIGSDDRLFGYDSSNATVESVDGGVTWSPIANIPSLAVSVLNYQFSVASPEVEPLDENTAWSADNTVKWGVSSQGVHYNTNGDWIHHGLWSCACDGQCGLKCNQEGYGLYE